MMDLLEDDTWMLQARYKVDKANNWYSSWNSQIYSSFVDHRMNNSLRNPTSVLAETKANTKNIGGRSEVTIRNKQSLIYLGFDGKFENITGNRERTMLMGPNEGKTMTDSVWQDGQLMHGGIFADLLRQTGKYKLSISGRLDLVSADAGSPSKSFLQLYPKISSTDLNTSFSAGISRQWSSDWFTGIWFGRGVRSANITERYINSLPVGKDPYEMIGNPTIKPEANNQIDLILSYKRANTKLELSTYYSVVDHYISSFINTDMSPKFGAPGVRQFTNIKAANLYGFEFIWFQLWMPQFNNQLRIVYINGQNSSTHTPLAEISPMTISYRVEGNFLNNRFVPYFEIRHSLKQNRIALDFGEIATDAFTVSDLGIRMIALKSLLISVGVNNIFDKEYREHLSRFISPSQPLFSVGRSLITNISFSF
jgi:iron complex outermembrane receptor protein